MTTLIQPAPPRLQGASPVIQTTALTRRFGPQVAVHDLTLTVYAGEIFGFLGHNGAGKTTTVRLLNGLWEPSSGHVSVLGLDPVTQGPALRQQTGVLTETPSLDERLSAYDNLAIFAAIYGLPTAAIPARIHSLLTTFGLTDRARERVSGYSKGMKQRLALARALLHQPELIFLDEPAAGLDPVATRDLHNLILHLSRDEGKTIFLCTHNLAEAQKLCDRVAVLQQGQMLALGTPKELARQVMAEVQLALIVAPTDVASAVATLTPLTPSPIHVDDDTLSLANITREQIPALLAALVQAGVRLYRVDHAEPTLEDVYFALHTPQPDLIS